MIEKHHLTFNLMTTLNDFDACISFQTVLTNNKFNLDIGMVSLPFLNLVSIIFSQKTSKELSNFLCDTQLSVFCFWLAFLM